MSYTIVIFSGPDFVLYHDSTLLVFLVYGKLLVVIEQTIGSSALVKNSVIFK